jgi:hypothetical protein
MVTEKKRKVSSKVIREINTFFEKNERKYFYCEFQLWCGLNFNLFTSVFFSLKKFLHINHCLLPLSVSQSNNFSLNDSGYIWIKIIFFLNHLYSFVFHKLIQHFICFLYIYPSIILSIYYIYRSTFFIRSLMID